MWGERIEQTRTVVTIVIVYLVAGNVGEVALNQSGVVRVVENHCRDAVKP
jgi:hypothetical protein